MSGLDSWEDDPAAQDENLSQQTQRNLNINPQGGRGNSFTPQANTFQPGAQSFQPGQQYQQYGGYDQSQQYGQYYNQQQQYGSAYPQYGQQSYNQYNQGYNQQPQAYNQGQGSQQRQVPIIAKRPTGGDTASGLPPLQQKPTPPKPAESSGPPPVKTLSIGGDTPSATAPKAKVLSIGVSAPSPAEAKTAPAEDGAKVAAAKALEKSEKPSVAANGTVSPSPSSGRSSPTAAEIREAKRETDAVEKEQAAQIDEEVLEEVYGKEHVNLIFIGHVDAGKSTLGGSILYATGMVDERTMDKYKREAKDAGRETWYLSWALDLTKEERSKGKTVEVGRGFFETDKRRYRSVFAVDSSPLRKSSKLILLKHT